MPLLPMTKQKNWLTRLSKAGIENPSQELRYIQRYALTDDVIEDIVTRRCLREPLAKIFGFKYFWKDSFVTNEHTLDPRPDSETLIEVCLSLFDSLAPKTILELGVGTGCLILSLLKEWRQAKGIGVDISNQALKVSQQNAENLGVKDRVDFLVSDWFFNIAPQAFDLIISNPPYIDQDEVINEEASFDPYNALYADDKGLAAYKTILRETSLFLNSGGFLVLEIGPSWDAKLETNLQYIGTHKDLSQKDRVVVYQKL